MTALAAPLTFWVLRSAVSLCRRRGPLVSIDARPRGIRRSFTDLGGPDSPEPPASWPRWTLTQAVGRADDAPGMDVWEAYARIGMPASEASD